MEPTSKERILKNIRAALIQPTDQPFPNIDSTSSVYQAPEDSLDVIFAEQFTKIQGNFVYCENEKNFIDQLNSLAEKNNWQNIFAWEFALQGLLQKNSFMRLRVGNNLEKADAGITTCECLVARTGSILVSSRKESGRALPIFPPVHIVLAYNNQLYYDLKEALQYVVEKYNGNIPSMISIASGPSRTADIEKTLVLGAHGPKEVYNNCASCHHEGGIGPVSFMTYDDVVNDAYNVQAYVVAGKMPPWPPAADCSYQLVGDRRLSDDDVNAINDWVNGGAPSGDLATAPQPPTFSANNSVLDGIDLTVSLPHYTVQLPTDEYRTFVVHSGFTTDHFINQIEVMPGNSAIVHHVLVYYDPTSASYNSDMQDTLAGFSTNGANTPSSSCIMISGWAPGSQAQKLPSNMAYLIPANSDFVVEVHYAPGHQGLHDSTKVNLKYCTVPSPRLVSVEPILFHYPPSINSWLNIPANTVKTFYEKSVGYTYDVTGDYSLISVAPHMHLIGKSWSVYMTSPDNTDTTRLVCIPDWNFHWQLGYEFHNLVHFNSGNGYHLRAEATYDNTSNNPNNPSNPPIAVTLGESTLDEMMIVFFTYVSYQAGDENIVLDQTTGVNTPSNPSLPLSLYPNPASDEVELSAILPANDFQIRILNTAGVVIKSFGEQHQPKGAYATRLSLKDVPQGIYLLEISSGGIQAMKKLVKVD